MSLYILLFAGSTPIGGFLIGVAWTLLICAGLCLAGVIGATLYHRRTV